MPEQYNAASIEVLSGLEPVQKRPGMYTDTSRPNHLVQEVIDNSIDEVLSGYANEIKIVLYEDGSIEISDNGRGMPVDIHPELGLSGVELIMTRLHAGGKFSDKNYQYSGGLHGVGVSVVNALSQKLDLIVKRNGLIYHMSFADGAKIDDLSELGITKKKDTGTLIRFWPKAEYFDSPKISIKDLSHLLKAKAILCPGLSITLENKLTNETTVWCYQENLAHYLLQSMNSEFLPNPPFSGSLSSNDGVLDWAVLWCKNTQVNNINESYVNLIPTLLGGTHVNGLRSGLYDAMIDFCVLRHLIPRGIKLSADDLFQTCQFVISVKLKEPQFAGQTKERLCSRQTAAFVSGIIKDNFSIWLNQHRSAGEELAKLTIERAQDRLRQSKKILRKKMVQGPALPGKLADCILQDLSQSELFLVEGDSAGGSAKQARSKDFQAILPLRGKILNSWDLDSLQVLASQEIHDISVAIGIDPGSNDLSGLRYGKICILADADSDGAHIASLITALFLKHFRPLVLAGHIYVAMPPLYRIDAGKDIYYALDDEERQTLIASLERKQKNKINVQRFKGLGEMNPIQLRETTMDPKSRRLVQLTIEKDTPVSRMDMLLSKKKAHDRKIWLEENGSMSSNEFLIDQTYEKSIVLS